MGEFLYGEEGATRASVRRGFVRIDQPTTTAAASVAEFLLISGFHELLQVMANVGATLRMFLVTPLKEGILFSFILFFSSNLWLIFWLVGGSKPPRHTNYGGHERTDSGSLCSRISLLLLGQSLGQPTNKPASRSSSSAVLCVCVYGFSFSYTGGELFPVPSRRW